jgi:alpha-mannosidase
MKKTLHVVFQTHWDREWYFSFERYRYRLTHVVERAMVALENHEIEFFILDGQTLPLEDYLEVCEPSHKERILKLIKSGQMIIGPWYIAMDEFLVHGESIIRNLEIGRKMANQYGTCQEVGYLPDTFGHIGQMPQILNEFSIDNAIMWRGIDLDQSEFIWYGVDESQLFTVFLSEGYYQPVINEKDYVNATKTYAERMAKYAQTDHMLLTAGGDHLMPTYDNLKDRIAKIEEANPQLKLHVTSYQKYIDLIKQEIKDKHLHSKTGELRSNAKAYILPNVLSTRSYLKQLNQELEDEMIGYLEPLMALAYMGSKQIPFSYVEHIWKTILQNQPHDSICGCSIDEVHQENEMRGLKAKQMINSFYEGLFNQMNVLPMSFYKAHEKRIDSDDIHFGIYNPHPFPYSGVIEGILWLNQEHTFNSFIIVDEKGNEYQTAISDIENQRLFVSPLDYPPLFRPGRAVRFKADVKELKPLTMTMFKVIEEKSLEVIHKTSYILENQLIKVELNKDGSLDLFDKMNQQAYKGWHKFYASMDAGDSYNYSKPETDVISYAIVDGKPQIEQSDISQTMTYSLTLLQPEGLHESRKFPLESKVETSIQVALTLHHNESVVKVTTSIDQKAKDQRLRVQFPLGVRLSHHTNDSAFELVKRTSNRKEIFVAEKQKEVPVVVDSSLSMIHGVNGKRGIQFFHRGLHESQMNDSSGHTALDVTLIRSVSHLSRDDFGSRGGAAGPNLPTPEAQCIRKHEFDYAFGPIDEKTTAVDTLKQANTFRKQPKVIKAYGDIKPSIIYKENDDIMLTSLRLIDSNQLEIRLWNPTIESQTTVISSDYTLLEIKEVTMDRRDLNALSREVSLSPNEIKTIHIKYKSR